MYFRTLNSGTLDHLTADLVGPVCFDGDRKLIHRVERRWEHALNGNLISLYFHSRQNTRAGSAITEAPAAMNLPDSVRLMSASRPWVHIRIQFDDEASDGGRVLRLDRDLEQHAVNRGQRHLTAGGCNR